MADITQAQLEIALDHVWKLMTGVMVFFMQAGFAMLEAGTVQRKNIKNILTKNVIDVCITGVTFWLWGFGLAFGCKQGCKAFIGDDDWALKEFESDPTKSGFVEWFFQFAFAATAATIVGGSVAERVRFVVYMAFTLIMSGFIYPVVVHWIWGGGWLFKKGMIDFAGGVVVHCVGGIAGLIAAAFVGPRSGRFEGQLFSVTVHRFQSFSPVFGTLGVLILWFGWFGFNCGSVARFTGQANVIETVAINTTLAPAGAVIVALAITGFPRYTYVNFSPVLNSCLAGLVSVTSGCAVLAPGVAFFVGCVGACVFLSASYLIKQFKIDDPLDACSVHYFAGVWGAIAVGLFAHPSRVKLAYSHSSHHTHYGLLYGSHDGTLLLWQFVGVVCVTAWVGCVTAGVLFLWRQFQPLRVSPAVEASGLDLVMHGGQELKSVGWQAVANSQAQLPAPTSQSGVVDRLVALASA